MKEQTYATKFMSLSGFWLLGFVSHLERLPPSEMIKPQT